MKDPGQALKDAYDTALQALPVNSQQVLFFKQLQESPSGRYMYISDYTATDDSAKDSFQTDCTITVNCVAPYHNAHGDITMADDIANEVLQKINVKAGSYLSLTGFFLITTTLDNSSEFIREENGVMASVRTLRFRHVIGES